MADDSGIDPRYAARFQRGYDPERHGPAAPASRPGPAHLPGGPPRISGGAPPAVERVPPPPPLVERAPVVDADAFEPIGDAPPRRPIAEWAVLGVSVLCLLISGYAFADLVERANTSIGPGADSVIAYTLASTMPGPFLIGGVVGLLVWIALRATGARRGG